MVRAIPEKDLRLLCQAYDSNVTADPTIAHRLQRYVVEQTDMVTCELSRAEFRRYAQELLTGIRLHVGRNLVQETAATTEQLQSSYRVPEALEQAFEKTVAFLRSKVNGTPLQMSNILTAAQNVLDGSGIVEDDIRIAFAICLGQEFEFSPTEDDVREVLVQPKNHAKPTAVRPVPKKVARPARTEEKVPFDINVHVAALVGAVTEPVSAEQLITMCMPIVQQHGEVSAIDSRVFVYRVADALLEKNCIAEDEITTLYDILTRVLSLEPTFSPAVVVVDEYQAGPTDLYALERADETFPYDDIDDIYAEELRTLNCDPYEPTAAKPGSEEKVHMLAARYAAGMPMWHIDDSYDHGPGTIGNVVVEDADMRTKKRRGRGRSKKAGGDDCK